MTAHCPVLPARIGAGDVSVTSPAPRAAWRAVLAADPAALPTQSPEWTDWLCRTRGYTDASRLYEFPGGRRLVLPLVARTAAGVPVTEESLPAGYGYGGALVDGGVLSPQEAGAVLADLARRPVLRASLTADPRTAAAWVAAAPPGTTLVPALAHVIDLDGGFDAVWSRFRAGVRRSVRQAEKRGLVIRTGEDPAAAGIFAELNRRSVDRWAQMRGQPLWLARLVERRRDRAGQLVGALAELGPMAQVWAAELDGEPVAANAVLRCGTQTHGWMNAMDRELARRTRAGTLLQSLAIEDACRLGARWFQLGESDPGSGVAEFKEGFGGVPVEFSGLRIERLPVTAAERRLRAGLARVAALRQQRNAGVGA
ncbi:GNAT family N-acetyltransferase [Geodermatophilus chilensis]|uniref:GNAT family N-acetyltransferase n=1 Tax=Geodermatophilus chilensis TaxID=2035835 RepID=UPI000C25F62B|nr:GNAT family N-acetyltransferase [Geodermatophilus chilensis]